MFFAVALLLYFPVVLFAADATLVYILGTVEVFQDGTWQSADFGEELSQGDRVRTGTGSTAIVELAHAGELKLREESEVMIERADAGTARTRLTVGGVFARVRQAFTGVFEVQSETVVAGVRGTEFFTAFGRTVEDAPDLWLCVNSGEVQVELIGTGEKRTVGAGEGINILSGRRLTDPRRYRWTLDLNWNMDPEAGPVFDETDLDAAYSDLLDQDYD